MYIVVALTLTLTIYLREHPYVVIYIFAPINYSIADNVNYSCNQVYRHAPTMVNKNRQRAITLK